MNSLYQSLQQNSLQSQYNVFMQNPMQFLMNHKVNVPQQFQNDSHGAVQYFLNNGQMSQQQFNRYAQIAQSMGFKLT